MNTETKPIRLTEIRIDGGTQTRAAIDREAVNEYAEAVHDGAKFPPVDIFYDGASNWLADGFHRYHAHKKAGVLDILATIHQGTVDDALQFALGANRANGLRRTNKDKHNCVKIALAKWPEWSDRRIAEVCGVAHTFVGKHRQALVLNTNTPTHRETSDGRQYPVDRQPPRQPETPSGAETSTEQTDLISEPEPEQAPEQEQTNLPEVPAKPTTKYVPAVAVDIAQNAIRILETIHKTDSRKLEALRLVITYCEQQLTENL
jgi:hypothetical protein